MSIDKRKLRAIDDGTIYDVPAKLMRLAREIRDGKHGKVTAAVVCVRNKFEDGNKKTNGYWYGSGSFEEAVFMMDMVKKEFIG